MEIVSAVRSTLAGKVGQKRFDLWFGAGTRMGYDGSTLSIGAPSQFFMEWIRSNFRRHIEDTCREVIGDCPRLEYHIETSADANGERRDGSAPKHATTIPTTAGTKQQKPQLHLHVADEQQVISPSSEAPSADMPRRRFATLD